MVEVELARTASLVAEGKAAAVGGVQGVSSRTEEGSRRRRREGMEVSSASWRDCKLVPHRWTRWWQGRAVPRWPRASCLRQ
jgi:hypothetical protein